MIDLEAGHIAPALSAEDGVVMPAVPGHLAWRRR